MRRVRLKHAERTFLNKPQGRGSVGDESVLCEQLPIALKRGPSRRIEIEPDVLGEIPLSDFRGGKILLRDDRLDVRNPCALDFAERIRRSARDIRSECPQREDERKPGASFPLLAEVEQLPAAQFLLRKPELDGLIADEQARIAFVAALG